jgi:hypothetical protein
MMHGQKNIKKTTVDNDAPVDAMLYFQLKQL